MIDFNEDRWEKVKESYSLWWEQKLERPLVSAVINDYYGKPSNSPKAPYLTQANCADFSFSAEEIVDSLDFHLSTRKYLADSYPFVNFNAFGPGIIAAMCGGRLDNSSGRVWFYYDNMDKPIEELHIELDINNIWLSRIKDIYHAAMKKWQGSVLVGMPDLGGVMDILATFRGTETLLMDLYDNKKEVKRLILEIEEAWYAVYNELAAVLEFNKYGGSDWSEIYSNVPSYVVQSDFSYMISTEMFVEFIKDTLKRDTEKLQNTIYHLDGKGELKHLDELLTLKNLKCVQWVAGAGGLPPVHWIDIYEKILNGGKNLEFYGVLCTEESIKNLDIIFEKIGQKNIYFPIIGCEKNKENLLNEFFNKYNIPV